MRLVLPSIPSASSRVGMASGASRAMLFAASPVPPAPEDPDLDLTIGRFFRRIVLYGLPTFLLGLIIGARGCSGTADKHTGTHKTRATKAKATPRTTAVPHTTKKKDH